jgi:RNA polymerase sigma-70 factor (ECF subfamily)
LTHLARQAADGDADALQQLIIHYHGPLCAAVARQLHPALNRHVDPEDVLQQAYVTAFNSIGDCSFEASAAFYRWLEAIALRRLQNIERDLHRDKRDIARNLTAASPARTTYHDFVDQLSAQLTSPSMKIAKREAAAAVISSLARLTDEQRQVVTMRFLEGRSPSEISQALGKTEDAVYAMCHRGLNALRDIIDRLPLDQAD